MCVTSDLMAGSCHHRSRINDGGDVRAPTHRSQDYDYQDSRSSPVSVSIVNKPLLRSDHYFQIPL